MSKDDFSFPWDIVNYAQAIEDIPRLIITNAQAGWSIRLATKESHDLLLRSIFRHEACIIPPGVTLSFKLDMRYKENKRAKETI